MFPVLTNMGGQAMGQPDVCNVPAAPSPVPTPFPNIAMLNMADPGTVAQKVLINNGMAMTMNSEVAMTSGDEAGSAGGVTSGMIKGPAKITKGSAQVMIEGLGAAHLTSMTVHNGKSPNCPAGQAIAPSQTMVVCS